jgi:beta-N-acetylhexosaminidase
VAAATDRVRALATQLATPPTAGYEPDDGPSADPDPISADRLVRAFDVQPIAEQWRDTRRHPVTVVRLQARPNSAAGPTPWGPPATESEIVVSATQPLPATPIPGAAVLVVGQDIHRHDFARTAVDRLRREHPQVLVVDMGWPSPDRRYADVATFGAAPVIGRALLDFLRLG